MKPTLIILVISFVGLSFGNPVEKIDKITVVEKETLTVDDNGKYEDEILRKLNYKCSQNDLNSCGLLKVVTYINKLLKKATIELTDDIEIKKTSQAKEEFLSFPGGRNSGQDDESEAFDLIANKIYAFIKSRSIKWRFLPDDDVVVSAKEDETGSLNLGLSIEKSDNAVQDGRGKKNNMGPLLAAAVLKIGLIGGLAFKGLALLVGKALLLSKIALLLASIIGLKKLFSQQKHVTYEVVSHPHHTPTHSFDSHGHADFSGGWARNFQEQQREAASKMAYSAQEPQNH